MKIPARLLPLLDVGIIDDVIRPLMSGKEAAVYLVEARGEVRVAKVYKEAQQRSFKHRADYTEGRKVRNSRRQRAMEKRSKYGREEMEAEWRTAEVDAIRKLRNAGVIVPEPFEFFEGVLVMELIEGEPGMPAPRLIDVALTASQARSLHRILLGEIVKMLCAGVVHGDLSDFNVLLREDGPVIIDFPQAVDPSFNNNAKKLFVRDVDNISSFLARFAPELGRKNYGKEIWQLYEKGVLDPEVELTGSFTDNRRDANVSAILDEIDAAREDALRKLGEDPRASRDARQRPVDPPRGRRGERPPSAVELAAEGTPRRREVYVPPPPPSKDKPAAKGKRRNKKRRGGSDDGRRRNDGPRGSDQARGPRRDGDARGPRRDGDARGHRRDGDARGHRRDGDSRGPRRDGDARDSRRDGDARDSRRDGGARGPRRGDQIRGPRREDEGRGPSRPKQSRPPSREQGAPSDASKPADGPSRKRRRRRRRRRGGGSSGSGGPPSGGSGS